MNEFKINDIYNVNCLEMLQGLEDNSIDSLITDPPYGLSKDDPEKIQQIIKAWATGDDEAALTGKGFMGKEWDAFVPPPIIWKEIYRVLKPGAYGLVFASTRTQDLMSISLRFAGFQIKDVVEWLYFSGFPKSHNISKAIDKKAGAEREVIGKSKRHGGGKNFSSFGESLENNPKPDITAPATPEAQKYEGWGTQLKPSHEPAILIQKPISEKTITDNVLKWGTGGLNIDETRIEHNEPIKIMKAQQGGNKVYQQAGRREETTDLKENGRFPANAITEEDGEFYSKYFNITPKELSKKAGKKDRNADYLGNEIGLEEKGKSKRKEEGKALFEGKNRLSKNNHPTVKPVALMEHFIKMITPYDGVVLDPFLGSGSTIVAARKLAHENEKYRDLNFIGSELSKEYFEICEARIFPELKDIKGA